jgi:integrin beta 1
MKDSASGSVKVTYFSKCLGNERMQTNTCKGLKVGDVVQFETEIVVTSCPADLKERNQTFQIYPVGVGESLTVNLETNI